MANKDYDVKNLTKIVTTIGEFETELTCEECEAQAEMSITNGTKFEFNSLITEMSFGNRINTCKELIKIDLKHVHILAYKAMIDIEPKLNERELLEAKKERSEKEEERLKVLQSKKDQWKRIQGLEKTIAELQSDKKEKELIYEKELIEQDIKDLDDGTYKLPEKKAD